MNPSHVVSVTFLGGLGAVGRNCAVVTVGGEALLIDCGIMFPDSDMIGVDLVIPDFTFLRRMPERIVGCVITHGHDDHHGALSYLLREFSFPLIGSPVSLALARGRLEEAGLIERTEFIHVRDGERRMVGAFDCEFLAMTHSVPQALAVALHTHHGVVLHTGDFKLDEHPVDRRMSALERIEELGRRPGIRLLLSDSTNAERPGRAPSESSVKDGIDEAFVVARGRRLVASCTSSQLHRIQQIADSAVEHGRTLAMLGRSLERNVRLGSELGVLHLDEEALVTIGQSRAIEPSGLCVIATGSQGEPMSTLARAAIDGNKHLELTSDDVLLLSSRAIPGNESAVNRMINQLVTRRVEVIHSGMSHVHASGHAQQDELRDVLIAAQPEWFVPIHGEPRHLFAHARIAHGCGVADEKVFVCDNGDRVDIDADGCHVARGTAPSAHVFVDGLLDDVTHGLLRDRHVLGQEGILAVYVVIDLNQRLVVVPPKAVSHGWVDELAVPHILEQTEAIAAEAVSQAMSDGVSEVHEMRQRVRRAVGQHVAATTKRRPVISPIVIDI